MMEILGGGAGQGRKVVQQLTFWNKYQRRRLEKMKELRKQAPQTAWHQKAEETVEKEEMAEGDVRSVCYYISSSRHMADIIREFWDEG